MNDPSTLNDDWTVLRMIRQGNYSTPKIAEELGASISTLSHDVTALRQRAYDILAERGRDSWRYRMGSRRAVRPSRRAHRTTPSTQRAADTMATLESITRGTAVRGILPDALVTIGDVRWIGTVAIEVTYKTPSGNGADVSRPRERSELVSERIEPAMTAACGKFQCQH